MISSSQARSKSEQLRVYDTPENMKSIGPSALDNTHLYAKDIEYTSLNAEEIEINKRLNEFKKRNGHRDRYSMLKGANIKSRLKRHVGFVPVYGYLDTDDPKTWDYLFDLRNNLIDVVDDANVKGVNQLLINYGKKLHHVAEMDANPQNLIDFNFYNDESVQLYSETLDKCFARSFFRTDATEIKFSAKKTSSLGFPWETVDGVTITNEMLTAHVSSAYNSQDFTKKIDMRYIKNWAPFKLEWRKDFENGSLKIFRNQIEVLKRFGPRVTPDNVIPYMESSIISVHKTAERENAGKSPVIGREHVTKDVPLFIEDRTYCKYIIEDGNVVGKETGLIDGKRYQEVQSGIIKQPGCSNRNRIISPSNNNMHCVGTVLASLLLHEAETDNRHGMPAPSDCVINGINDFISGMAGKGYTKFAIGNGDGVNAEVTMTTSWDLIIRMWPERFRDYLNLTANSVSTYQNYLRFHAKSFCSAVWYTTIGNIVKGNFEMARIFYALIKEAFGAKFTIAEKEFIKIYTECIFINLKFDSKEFKKGEIGRYYDEEHDCLIFDEIGLALYPLLGTDDVNCAVAGREEVITSLFHAAPKLKRMLDATLMTFDLLEEVVTFGSRISADGMYMNKESSISKVHYNESMGFALRDGFSTYFKMQSSPYYEIFNDTLIKHFGDGVSQYAPFVDGFIGYLLERGVAVGEVFNEYSPSDKILIDKFTYERFSELFDSGVVTENGVLVDASTYTNMAASSTASVVDKFKLELTDAFYYTDLEVMAALEYV